MDCDLDCSIRPEMVAVVSMTFREPMPNSSPDLTDKLEAALLSQMTEIADQVCDGILLSGAAVLLESRDGLGGRAVWSRRRVRFNWHALRYFAMSWRLLKERPQILQLVE
jgi:hypothetical protein